jgi:hypothetical protein
VAVPGTTFARLDVERAQYQKDWLRRTRGYHGQRTRKQKVTDLLKVRLLLNGRLATTTRIESDSPDSEHSLEHEEDPELVRDLLTGRVGRITIGD